MSAATAVESPPVVIVVQRTEILRHGHTRQRKPYTLYKVYATTPGGDAIAEELRTFDALDVGEQLVTMEPRCADDGVTVDSYTVRRVRDLGEQVDAAATHANEVRRRRSAARAVLVGERPAEPPANELSELRERMDALETRLELVLSIVRGET